VSPGRRHGVRGFVLGAVIVLWGSTEQALAERAPCRCAPGGGREHAGRMTLHHAGSRAAPNLTFVGIHRIALHKFDAETYCICKYSFHFMYGLRALNENNNWLHEKIDEQDVMFSIYNSMAGSMRFC
jgi:hypothetical protein